jgi:hypothetical protein
MMMGTGHTFKTARKTNQLLNDICGLVLIEYHEQTQLLKIIHF